MKIAREGLMFILPCLGGTVIFSALGWWVAAVVFLLAASIFAFFFRNPNRKTPEGEGLLIAPADGKVVKIETLKTHPRFTTPVTRISIFLSLFDVHITRAPQSGTIQEVEYHPGKFFPAYKEEASTANESNSILMSGEKGTLLIRQIVGVAARRIKCYVREKQRIVRGEKIGLMYFGSRVEVYFSSDFKVKTRLSQKVKAGVTVIGEVKK